MIWLIVSPWGIALELPSAEVRSAALRVDAERLARSEQWSEAVAAGGELLALRRKKLGAEHPDVAWVDLFLGQAREQLGELRLAEEHFRRGVAVLEKALPPTAPELPAALTQLAANLKAQRRYDEALPLLRRALDLQVRALGPAHPQVAWAQRNVGWILRLKDDAARALPFFEKALAIHLAAPVPEPDVLAAGLLEVAQLYETLGNLPQAESCAAERLVWIEKRFGSGSREVARTLGEIGSLAMRQERFTVAEAHFRRALAIWETLLDAADPQRADAMTSLGSSLQKLGRLDEALPLFQKALSLRQRALGPANERTAEAHRNLGWILRVRGDLEGALPQFQEALTILERARNEADSATLQSLGELADLQRLRGLWEEAEPLAIRRRELAEKHFGPGSAEAAASWQTLAVLYESAARWGPARIAGEKLLALQGARLGGDSFETASARRLVARICTGARDFAAAQANHTSLAAWIERHPEVSPEWKGEVLREHALASLDAGARSEAAALFAQVRTWHEQEFGADDARTLRSLNDLWTLHESGGDTAQAIEVARELVARSTRALGPVALVTRASAERLAELYAVSGNRAGATELRERIASSARDNFGATAPETFAALGRLASSHEASSEFAAAIALRRECADAVGVATGAGSEETQRAVTALAATLRASGDSAAALALLEAKTADSKPTSVLEQIAELREAMQNWPGAARAREELATRSASNEPAHAAALFSWSETLLRAGNRARAGEILREARRLAAKSEQWALGTRIECTMATEVLRSRDVAGAAALLQSVSLTAPHVHDENAARALSVLGGKLEGAGQLGLAEQAHATALACSEDRADDSADERIERLQRLAIVRLRLGKGGAEALVARALAASEIRNGSASSLTIDLLGWLALARMETGRFTQAAAAAEDMFQRRRAALGEGLPVEIARALTAWTSFPCGDREALAKGERAFGALRKVWGPQHPIAWCAKCLLSAGRFASEPYAGEWKAAARADSGRR